MSIATEITRLQGAKSDIRNSIIAKGVDVPSAETLDNYSGYIDQISGGGGTTDPMLDEYAFLEVVHKASNSINLGVNWAKGYYSNPLAQSNRNFTLYYSYDKQTWNSTTISANGYRVINLPSEGEKIYFKASHDSSPTCWGANGVPAHFYIQRSGGSTGGLTVKAGGNVLSLSWGDDFKGKTTWRNVCFIDTNNYSPSNCLTELFSYNSQGEMLVGIDDLRIPLQLGSSITSSMFNGNTGLTGVLDFRKILFGDTCSWSSTTANYGMLKGLRGSPTIILPEIGTVGSGRLTSQWTASYPANKSYAFLNYIFGSDTYVKNVWVKYIDPSYTGSLNLGLSASSGTIHTTSDSKITIPTGWTRVNDYDTNIPPLVY